MAARKRKDPPQSVTLDNFFGANALAGPSKRGKSDERVNVKTTGTRSSRPAVDDIIVIDSSDDDVAVVVTEATSRPRAQVKRKLSESSSDVEIVSECVVKRPPSANISSGKQGAQEKAGKGPPSKLRSSSGGDAINTNTSPSMPSTRPLFGKPSDLLCSSFSFGSDRTVGAVPLKCEAGKRSGFGIPRLLGEESKQHSKNSLEDGITKASFTESQLATEADMSSMEHNFVETESSATFDDDWGMGDDEKVIMLEDDDGLEETNVLEVYDSPMAPIPPSETLDSCPVCRKSLNGMPTLNAEEHVNECLDVPSSKESTSAGSSTKREPAPSRVLHPLTSLQPPARPGSIPATKSKLSGSNAFSALMSSHKENEAWKEATEVEDRGFRPTKSNGGRRKAPFYKVLQGMPIAVDAFRYGTIPGITAYFLTHAHSDHYTNLASNWKSGPIYCSEGTANLIIHMLSVDRKWVHPLPMDVATVVPNTGGVTVTLIEANHCPGSCLFMFEGQQTVNAGDSAYKSGFVGSLRTFRYLHCGDFRASPAHVLHPAVKGKRIDHVYLDTTYLDSKYMFPPQPQVISACADLASRLVADQPTTKQFGSMAAWMTSSDKQPDKKAPDTLFVVGTYSIGKERIVKAIAKSLGSKVYCDARKTAILRCQCDPELHALLTSDPLAARVHLMPLGMINSDKLKLYAERFKSKFSKVVGFRPTGWTYTPAAGADQLPSIASLITRGQQRVFTHANLQPARNSTAAIQLYGVPYSEHSSFFELTCFAMSLEWGKMIATVNVGSESSRAKMTKWVEKWEAEKKKRGKDIVPYRKSDYW